MNTIADRLIEDEGLKRGLAHLTPEIIEKTFKELIAGECGARLKTYMASRRPGSGCSWRCGACIRAAG